MALFDSLFKIESPNFPIRAFYIWKMSISYLEVSLFIEVIYFHLSLLIVVFEYTDIKPNV